MKVLLISTDLMVSSMLEGAARQAGAELLVAGPANAIDKACECCPSVVIFDLAASLGDVGSLLDDLGSAAPGVRFIAFGPHVHKAKLDAARQAGCDRVMTRGEFHTKAAEVIAEFARPS